jgi:hypothetical protein
VIINSSFRHWQSLYGIQITIHIILLNSWNLWWRSCMAFKSQSFVTSVILTSEPLSTRTLCWMRALSGSLVRSEAPLPCRAMMRHRVNFSHGKCLPPVICWKIAQSLWFCVVCGALRNDARLHASSSQFHMESAAVLSNHITSRHGSSPWPHVDIQWHFSYGICALGLLGETTSGTARSTALSFPTAATC